MQCSPHEQWSVYGDPMPDAAPIDVLIVGGGFAGLYAAKSAARHLSRVVLVDSSGLQTFQPLLYQVASGLLPVDVVDYPLDHTRGIEVVTAEVAHIDLAATSVTMRDGRTLSSERLVIATGAHVDFYGVQGAAEYAVPLYTAADAREIKRRIQSLVEANKEFDVVIVGAGATGVELAGILREVIHEVLPRTYPQFRGEDVTVHVVDHADAPLAHMSTATQAYARKVLEGEGVVFHLGSAVISVESAGVTLADGRQIPAGMVVWAGGLSANVPSSTPGLETGHGGRVLIDATLRVADMQDMGNVYCVGDCSADAHEPLPQLGSVAKQQGIHVGHSLYQQKQGREPEPFVYRDRGTMAMLGHDRAAVELGPKHLEIEGALAATMWLGLHAALLPDGHARAEAVHDWMHEWATKKSSFLGT
jgi:NADH:ubiquinone reductase (H+-translocating)